MRAKIKIVVDMGMIILVLLQMAYHLIGDSLHRWLGIMLFVLMILHNILDRKWYLGLFKGKYTLMRFFRTAINILLLASFLCVAVSAVFLSSTLSSLFHLKAAMLGRRMHMVFTTWSFVLMSAHVGLHWNMMIAMMNKKIIKQRHRYCVVAKFSTLLIVVYGLYAFLSRELPQRMFLRNEYSFFNYNESIWECFIDYFSILWLFSFFVYCVIKMISSRKETSVYGGDDMGS